jgi:hypothetical protein
VSPWSSAVFWLPAKPHGGVRFNSNGYRILVQAGSLTQLWDVSLEKRRSAEIEELRETWEAIEQSAESVKMTGTCWLARWRRRTQRGEAGSSGAGDILIECRTFVCRGYFDRLSLDCVRGEFRGART